MTDKTPAFLKKHGLREGDTVRVSSQGQEFAGIILPGHVPDTLTLKLGSGYNAGISVSRVSSVKKTGSGTAVAKPAKKPAKNTPGLPTIAILHTGGTIASRIDYRTGAVYSNFNPEDLLSLFPELAEIANFRSTLVRNMWSDDLRFAHLTLLAKAIQKEARQGARGIIVGMGTDNLAVAAAGLAFALETCPIPVLLVGAQRSSDRGGSDAAMNLVCAATFITNSDFAGVAICMHHTSSDTQAAILPPCKTRKLHTSRRDAFKPVNDTPIALVEYDTKKISWVKKEHTKRSPEKMVIKPGFEERVALLKITMNMFPEQFAFFSKHKFKGLVIEGTGLGHTPGHMPDEITKKAHKKILVEIEKFAKKGVAVMTSQCLFGRVHMHVYDKGTDLLNAGVIPGEDMLPETAFVKLAWVLANHKKADVPRIMRENLRGEISGFTRSDTFNISGGN